LLDTVRLVVLMEAIELRVKLDTKRPTELLESSGVFRGHMLSFGKGLPEPWRGV
jgi:hypothetical protein